MPTRTYRPLREEAAIGQETARGVNVVFKCDPRDNGLFLFTNKIMWYEDIFKSARRFECCGFDSSFNPLHVNEALHH